MPWSSFFSCELCYEEISLLFQWGCIVVLTSCIENQCPNFLCVGFSDVIKKSADPAWRQTFFLYVQDKISQKLDILVESVNEKDDTENQELGTATLENLDEICDGDIHNMSVKLHR